MRTLILVCLVVATAGAQAPDRPSPARSAPKPPLAAFSGGFQSRVHALMNVELLDKSGKKTTIVAFHRVSGENRFVGYLGASEIELPYENAKEVRIMSPEEPGGRMRARFQLRSGKEVKATFDEREGEQLFAGYSEFGRVTVFWRDIRHLVYTARTKTTDLPKYGKATGAVDVRLRDRDGVETELVGFKRAGTDNMISGLRGATRVEVPLRIVSRLTSQRAERSVLQECVIEFRGDRMGKRPIKLRLKRYDEQRVYRGRAEFGDLRIHLSEIRELIVHRSTPVLRDLDPVAAAEGREIEIGETPRR